MAEQTLLLKPPKFDRIIFSLKSTKEVDWIAGLREHFINSGEDPINFKTELNVLHGLRQDTRGAPASPMGIEILVNYYRQLDSLSRRLTFAEKSTSLSFVWYDSLDTDVSIKQGSVAFEKANILYNMASLYSQMVMGDGLVKNLQNAASVMTFIADNFLHAPLIDISRPVLIFTTSVLMAQAQELVVIKAVEDNKSLATICKLAKSCLQQYNAIVGDLKQASMEHLADLLHHRYTSNLKCSDDLFLENRARIWEILYEYFQGEADYENTRIGDAICRIQSAIAIIKESTQKYSNIREYVEFETNILPKLESLCAKWEKENSVVYNQLVPSRNGLKDVEGTCLVKVVPITECWKAIPEKADLFIKLVPLRVHEETSKYSEEKSKLLRYETLKVTSSESELQTTLASMGFPGVMDAVGELSKTSKRDILSDDILGLREKALNLDTSIIESTQVRRDTLSADIIETLSQISLILEMEISEYQKGSLEFASQWTQSASHTQNEGFFNELHQLQTKHRAKVRSLNQLIDGIPRNELTQVELLKGPTSALESALSVSLNLGPDTKDSISNIQKSLTELETLSKSRALELTRLKQMILGDDISNVLAVTKVKDTSSIFANELAKFDDPCKHIEDSVLRQSNILKEFKSLWSSVGIDTKYQASIQHRQDRIASFKTSLQEVEKCIISLRGAVKDLEDIKQGSLVLLKKSEEFAVKRGSERERIMSVFRAESAQQGREYLMDKLRSLSLQRDSPPPLKVPVKSPTVKGTEKMPKENINKPSIPANNTGNTPLPAASEPSLLD